MSDFLANGLPRKIDALMDRLYGAGISSHQTIIEQINYLLFLRELSKRDDEKHDLGIEDENEIVFDKELKDYKWKNLLVLNPEPLFSVLEECYRSIPLSTTNSTVQLLYRNAHLKIYDRPTLHVLLHEIDEFGKELDKLSRAGQKDVFGDMYEYLLSKLSQAGTNGQFRTPRHIIDFIVAILDPSKGETILDPACGTAGFLVKAYEHLAKKYTSERYAKERSLSFDKLNTKEKLFLLEDTFTGFDSDEEMIKFGLLNLYLHRLEKVKLKRQNTLTETGGSREKWDIILTNPPFTGTIDRESVSEDIEMGTGATEVLFLRYMIEHLKDSGRMGVIVPEGILFKKNNAYGKIRQLLIERGLWCVISLPVGIFNPYTKTTKTTILFVDKEMSRRIKKVYFIDLKNDGYDLGAERFPIDKNDIPDILNLINTLKGQKNEKDRNNFKNSISFKLVSIKEIQERPGFNLSVLHDFEEDKNSEYNSVKIGEILNKVSRPTLIKDDTEYRQVTVKMNGKGVVLRRIIKGREVKTKRQFIAQKGDFIMSKIDARNGAFGIVPAEIDGAIVTQDFPLFTVNKEVMVPDFLQIIVQSPQFISLCQKTSVGTSNRRRVNLTHFLAAKIPLPKLEVQKKILAETFELESKIKKAQSYIQNYQKQIQSKIAGVWEK